MRGVQPGDEPGWNRPIPFGPQQQVRKLSGRTEPGLISDLDDDAHGFLKAQQRPMSGVRRQPSADEYTYSRVEVGPTP